MQEAETYEYVIQATTPASARSNKSERMVESLNFASSRPNAHHGKSQQQQQQQQQKSRGENKSNQSKSANAPQSILREKLVHAIRLNRKKQITLERINKYNQKLMEELKTPRVKASNCALMVINYTEQTKDPLIPSLWGETENNKFKRSGTKNKNIKNMQMEQSPTMNSSAGNGCCTIM